MSKQKEKDSLWDSFVKGLKGVGRWVVRYPLALIISVLVVVAAVLLMILGIDKGQFNWGGIISKLFGEDEEKYSKVELANKVPENRKVGKEEVGDSGFVQKEVQILEQSSNPLRDKSKITVKDEDGNEETVKLPEGVTDESVEKIYKSEPGSYTVDVKGTPSDKDLDSLENSLKK